MHGCGLDLTTGNSGINLADASIFLACATTLALFDIKPVVEDGKEIIPEVAYTTGTIRRVSL